MGLCVSRDQEDLQSNSGRRQDDKQALQVGKGGSNTHIHRTNMPLSPKRSSERRGPLSMGGRIHTVYYAESGLRVFGYEELRQATRNFRPDALLGEGGFGSVFQGWIDEGKQGQGEVVAVKVLDTEGLQGHREWLAEVDFLGQLHHKNLVRLIGYCSEQEQRLLVYEFMPRGSLENHLFRRPPDVLPWSTRMKAALGAAQGLAYLHEEAERQVIYRDFKTSNILLDHDFTAKLSDFGLAKDGPEGDKTHVSTRVMGTYGYAAPEYVMTGHLTAKSDVYSYGVVLLEMITGRRSMDKSRPSEEHNLVDWARQFFADRRKLFRLMDPRLEGRYSIRGATKAALLAQHCLSRDPKARPLMSDVVETLKPLQELADYADMAAQPMGGPLERTRASSAASGSPRMSPSRIETSAASAARQRQLQTAANMKQYGRTGF